MSHHHDLLAALERSRAELTRAHELYLAEVSRAHSAYIDASRALHARIAALSGGPAPHEPHRDYAPEPASAPEPSSERLEAFGAWPGLDEHPPALSPERPALVTADRAGLFGALCDALTRHGVSARPISSTDDLPGPPASYDLIVCEPFPEPADREDSGAALGRTLEWAEAAGHARSVCVVQSTRAGFGLRAVSPHLAPLTAAAALARVAPALDVDLDDVDAAAQAIAIALTTPQTSHVGISSRGELGFGWTDRIEGEDALAPSPLSADGSVWIVGAPTEPFLGALSKHVAESGRDAVLLLAPEDSHVEWPHDAPLVLDLERDISSAFDALSALDPPGVVVLAGDPELDEHALAWAVVALLHAPDAAALTLHPTSRDAVIAASLDATCAAHVSHTPGMWRAVTAHAGADDALVARALHAPAPTLLRILAPEEVQGA